MINIGYLINVDHLRREIAKKKCKLELLVNASLYDRFQTSYAFLVEVKIGEEAIAEWQWQSHTYAGKFVKRVRFPLKVQYLSQNVSTYKG